MLTLTWASKAPAKTNQTYIDNKEDIPATEDTPSKTQIGVSIKKGGRVVLITVLSWVFKILVGIRGTGIYIDDLL
jgi:hypothetical protein